MRGVLERVPGRPPVRVGRFSGVHRPRTVAVALVGVALVVLAAAAHLGRGDFPLPLTDVLAVLVGGGDATERFVVLDLRLPRTLTGLLVGAALGVSGAIVSSVARNPLASPDVLGVTAGAGTAAVAVIVLGGAVTGPLAGVGLPVAALVGGLASAALVYALAHRGGIGASRLVLVGVGVGAVATSLTSWLLVLARVTEAAEATVWLTGSLHARGWEHVVPVGLALAVLLPLALLMAFPLGALQFGDDTAAGLGLRVGRTRALLLLVAVALAAVATASAGPIEFVALVVPQICRRLVGAAGPPLLVSAVYGALLVVAADLVARTVLPVELPVGIVTAILGAPYLVALLVRRNRGVPA